MKIAVFLGGKTDSFLRDILAWLGKDHEVRVSNALQEQEIAELCRWADLAWVEWAAEAAIQVSRAKRPCPVVVRLHSFEAYGDHPGKIRWDNIDTLVVVAEHVRVLLDARYPGFSQRLETVVIPNGVDLSAFTMKGDFTPSHKIAFVGTLRHTKNVPLLLQCFKAIADQHPAATLHVAGDYQQWSTMEAVELSVYIGHQIRAMGLEGRVEFCGKVENMNDWLQDKDAFISTSMRESFGYAIAEAIAVGLKPAIHHFPGAEQIWPERTLFNTVDECRRIVLEDSHDPKKLRALVESQYSLARQLARIQVLLDALTEKAPARQDHIGEPGRFKDSATYWENRYGSGGTSGSGSYGRLSRFKAAVLNRFVRDHGVGTVVEFGCGDGNQLALAEYPQYVGLDITDQAVALCRKRHGTDLTKQFFRYDPAEFDSGNRWLRGDLVMSLDVIFHIVEDEVFEQYMRHLFACSDRYVVVYSSNQDRDSGVSHVRHRKFTGWVKRNCPEFELLEYIPNEYPYDSDRPEDTSFSDFYFYEKRG